MMDNLTVPASSTPLATLLEGVSTNHRLTVYRGALTLQELDVPEKEIEALVGSAGVHDLGWLKRVAVRGEDRFRWLSGMVTNMVNDLPQHGGAWNLVLNAQGRIQGDLHVWRDGDGLELQIAADQYEKLIGHLERFIIMDDVELATLDCETAVGLTGPLANEVLGRLTLPTIDQPMTSVRVEWNGLDLKLVRGYGVLAPHYEFWVPAAGLSKVWKYLKAAGAHPVGCGAVEALRIAEGIPAYGVDMVERDLPQETSQMRTLHFSKGCYLGQEIVERIHSRGNVHRHLRQLELSGPVPPAGTELTADGVASGTVTSAAELAMAGKKVTYALGMMRGEAEIKMAPMSYQSAAGAGTAKILKDAPVLA